MIQTELLLSSRIILPSLHTTWSIKSISADDLANYPIFINTNNDNNGAGTGFSVGTIYTATFYGTKGCQNPNPDTPYDDCYPVNNPIEIPYGLDYSKDFPLVPALCPIRGDLPNV